MAGVVSRHREELLNHIRQLGQDGVFKLDLNPLYGRYAYIARLSEIATDQARDLTACT